MRTVAWQDDSSQLQVVFNIAEDASDDVTSIALADEMKEMKEVPETTKALASQVPDAPSLVLTIESIA